MDGMPAMQEQLPAYGHGWSVLPEMQEQFLIARDGVNAENAGAIFGRLWPWMAGMPDRRCSRHLRALPTSCGSKMQEQFPAQSTSNDCSRTGTTSVIVPNMPVPTPP